MLSMYVLVGLGVYVCMVEPHRKWYIRLTYRT